MLRDSSRSPRLLILALAILALLGLGSAAVVGAQDGGPTFVYSPTSGAPGTRIQLSGTCPFGAGGRGDAAFVRLARVVSAGETPFDTSVTMPVREDGTFSGELVVPADAPPDEYELRMNCIAGDQTFGDQERPFQVLPGTGSSTTTTVSSPTTLPVAPPASPVDRDPTYTG